jgi:hypothetical protein
MSTGDEIGERDQEFEKFIVVSNVSHLVTGLVFDKLVLTIQAHGLISHCIKFEPKSADIRTHTEQQST